MSTSHRQPTLDEQLCFSLYGASMAITRAYKPLLDALDITYPQYLVLSALWEGTVRPWAPSPNGSASIPATSRRW